MTAHATAPRRIGLTAVSLAMALGLLLSAGNVAHAAIAPAVPLGTSADYAVLGGSTVTNTGNSTLDGSLGLWPGTSITGFPPGRVLPPGRTDRTNAVAQQAQSDLTVAYENAAGRPVDATTTSDLGNLKLPAGVYAGPSRSPLGLTGSLVLDGAGDPSSVFIFQTDSTLITASSSTVSLINGAQECNVFWQVGSSATLGEGSVFVGNILALTSITVNNSVTVHGRVLARNGAVTLDNDTFTRPTCATTTPGGISPGSETGTTPGGTESISDGGTGTIPAGSGSTPDSDSGTTPTGSSGRTPGGGTGITSTDGSPGVPGGGGPDIPSVVGPPRTGADPLADGGFPWVLFVTLAGGAGVVGTILSRREHALAAPTEA